MGEIAKNWKELSGKNDWEGLLDPLNINLRQYIIHYGERVQAVYDSFNYDKTSGLYGFPLYAPKDIFSNVGLEKGNSYHYTVTNYLYAMIDIDSNFDWIVKDQSTWIGYVAVATDYGVKVLGRRDILVCWRGTSSDAEWIKNLQFVIPTHAQLIFPKAAAAKVHRGFYSIYTTPDPESGNKSARDQVIFGTSVTQP